MGNILTKFISKMLAIASDYDSLSVRQRKLNAAVNEAFSNKRTIDEAVSSDNQTDIDNIYKIDLASKYRNVDYVIENLKSTDSLRVARALKARWLFTDNEYSHIINPTYVSNTLRLLMSDEAFNKFMRTLARHMRDEKRCKKFYLHFVQMKNKQYMGKFLLKCSIPFIKSRIATRDFDVTPKYLLRLSLKSQEILDAYIEAGRNISHEHIDALKHLIDAHGDFYLDLLENHLSDRYCNCVHLGQRVTREIIRNHKERIFEEPYTYLRMLHFKQLAHALTLDEVRQLAFLVGEHDGVWRNDVLKSLINLLPSEEQYELIKSVFEKLLPDQDFEMNENFTNYEWYKYMSDEQREEWALKRIAQRDEHFGKFYKWYKFVGFSKAFVEMKKLLRVEPYASEREAMLEILISSCNDNESNICKLLRYFHDRCINEIIFFKQSIIGKIMEQKCLYKCGDAVWNILNELLLSLRIYENENNCTSSFKRCAIAQVISNRVIYNKPITEKMFKLYGKYYTMLITNLGKEKVFDFSYKWLVEKINEQDLKDSKHLREAVKWTNELSKLIKHYKRPVNAEVVGFIRQIREHDSNALSKIVCDEMFKEFFPEKEALLREDVCLQMLKKDVASLDSCRAQFDFKIQSSTMKYGRFLSKIRIYFGRDLALEWRNYYLDKLKENLEDPTGCACVLFGLSVLMPAPEYEELIKQYQPENAKVVWSETDPCLFHIQTNISKFMCLVRPTINHKLMTSFAKGDFLQYTANNLISVGRKLTREQCREMIGELIASPVSIQKHGIRMAIAKFTMDELIVIFGKMWAESDNVSIRQLLFNSIDDMLIATEDDIKCLAIWKLLSTIMTQLHGNEYITKIVNPSRRGWKKVILSVRPQYCTAYWHLLQTAQDSEEVWEYRTKIIETMIDGSLVNLLDDGLLKGLILSILPSLFHKGFNGGQENRFYNAVCSLIAIYAVLCETKEVAERRKNDVLTAVTQKALSYWNPSTAERFLHFLRKVLIYSKDIFYNDGKAFYNPVHVLEYVQKEFDSKILELEHYKYRLWLKFAVILIRSFSESRLLEPGVCVDNNHLWVEIFCKHVVELMGIEISANYPHLPQTFGNYLKKFVYCELKNLNVKSERFYIGISKVLLEEKEDIHCFALVLMFLRTVPSFSNERPVADVMLNSLREKNIPELNLLILSKNCNYSAFGY